MREWFDLNEEIIGNALGAFLCAAAIVTLLFFAARAGEAERQSCSGLTPTMQVTCEATR